MPRESEIADALILEQEMGQRRRHGHFGVDAHRAIGPQTRVFNEGSGRGKASLPSSMPSARPFRAIELKGGHIVYKPQAVRSKK